MEVCFHVNYVFKSTQLGKTKQAFSSNIIILCSSAFQVWFSQRYKFFSPFFQAISIQMFYKPQINQLNSIYWVEFGKENENISELLKTQFRMLVLHRVLKIYS